MAAFKEYKEACTRVCARVYEVAPLCRSDRDATFSSPLCDATCTTR